MINKEDILKKIAFYDKKLKEKPNDKKLLKLKIGIYREVENYNEMLTCCNNYLKIYPQDLLVCIYKAICLIKQNDRKEAKELIDFVDSGKDKFVHDDEMAKMAFFKELELINHDLSQNTNQNDKTEKTEKKENSINEEKIDEKVVKEADVNKEANVKKDIVVKRDVDFQSKEVKDSYNVKPTLVEEKKFNIPDKNESTLNNQIKSSNDKDNQKYSEYHEDDILNILHKQNINVSIDIKDLLKELKKYSKLKSYESLQLLAQTYFKLFSETKSEEFLKYALHNYDDVLKIKNTEPDIYFKRGEISFYLNNIEAAQEDYKAGIKIANSLLKSSAIDKLFIENLRSDLRSLLLSKGILLDDVLDINFLKIKKDSNNENTINNPNNNANDNQVSDKEIKKANNDNVDIHEMLALLSKNSEKFLEMEARISKLESIIQNQDAMIKELQTKQKKK